MATPRFAGGTPRIGLPPIDTIPPLIGSRPQIMRSNVDFPQPDGPMKTRNSPCSIVRSIPGIMTFSPYFLETPESSTLAISKSFLTPALSVGHENAAMDACDAFGILGVVDDVEAAICAQRQRWIAEIPVGKV